MRTDQVPQDKSTTYAGHKKLLYAQDESGRYCGVQSSGWAVEAAATLDAVALYRERARQAWQEVHAGRKSPLYFHMHHCRMDLVLLSQLTGLWRWRVKRHFAPRVFARLSPAILARYAQAMDVSPAQLTQLPEQRP
ncbi:hypothetical protein [Gilvimarinus xylanilyticus]|uniref:Uncharacterized protein n=1 Tax=Gilvimarinus xylanilyticus TaxID=2944139 RepID=A0A9X2KTQ8_9GAMM|nr:hypothetical protein [Gilvimarinus xylanilyticus]MCP8900146.1 hypothetical protein [Gilvimarinus xylanilyticus]